MNPEHDVKKKAMLFACFAHSGQLRKSDLEKPYIVHPIHVARILEEYGFDDNVVAAGYLHDVIEDTKYTKEDLLNMFGEDICNLVVSASENDKSKSWEERKLETIRKVRGKNDREKAVICADKISNLESLKNLFERKAVRDFSAFNRGEEMQSWYYTGVHRSLVFSVESEENPMYDRLKELVDEIFYGKISEEEKEAILFIEDKDRLCRLKKLKAITNDIKLMKALKITDNCPYVIEFTGTMRAGKTSAINAVYEFLKKAGFSVKIVEEFTTSQYYKSSVRPKYKSSSKELHEAIFECVCQNIENAKKEGFDVILVDRGLNDRLIWLYSLFALNQKISSNEYGEMVEKWQKIAESGADLLMCYKVKSEVAMKRDFMGSLSLEKRRFLNLNNINEYNVSMNIATIELFSPSTKIVTISTDNLTTYEANLKAAEIILSNYHEFERKRVSDSIDEMVKECKEVMNL